jgi:hypothetical protein
VEIKYVNCAGCRRPLLGESMRGWLRSLQLARRRLLPPLVRDRLRGRPYCAGCLTCPGRGRRPSSLAAGSLMCEPPWETTDEFEKYAGPRPAKGKPGRKASLSGGRRNS